jgi:uncharacterized protein (TIGR02145 family)
MFQIKSRMKKRILFLGFLLMVFGLRIDAQTLKNIHRHNQPVLRIPTHLIDKVETTEVNGAQVLQVRQLNGYVSEIPISQIDSITHSEGEAVDPAQLGNLRTVSVMGVVTGPTGAPEMNAIVRSPYGGEQTETDQNGVFFLNNILVYDKLGYITITKPGFHQGSRSFLPLETGSNRVNVQLLPMALSGSFDAASGGSVSTLLFQVVIPANAVALNGQSYNGTVNIYSQALDPTSANMFDRMPGELLGGMNDSLRLLRSFGMASVELRDTNLNELQLATGVSATLKFNIPTSLQAAAPQTIDWWSFDETQGYWKHEGEAQRQGNQYVGLASHFSWWNYDVPENFNNLYGTVNSTGGAPVSDAQVNVVTQTLGTGVTYTNSEGVFSGRVPKNQQLTLNVYLTCSTTNELTLVHTETINNETQDLSVVITTGLEGSYPLTGTVATCQGQPVEEGYVKMGNQVYFTTDGAFVIQTCFTGLYSIRGFDLSNIDSVKVSDLITVVVGTSGGEAGIISTCSAMFDTLSDHEGHIYPIVLIGNQWWMAENLRSSTYANGEIIPQVTDESIWDLLTTPAWCNYDNQAANDPVYGKLYTWYAVSDPRNICPTGWHVPAEVEWSNLSEHLGVNANWKMKSTSGWPNAEPNATNESGFSAIPAGKRTIYFSHIGLEGNWWTSSENGEFYANYRFIYSSDFNTNGILLSGAGTKRIGYSVRCVKD